MIIVDNYPDHYSKYNVKKCMRQIKNNTFKLDY